MAKACDSSRCLHACLCLQLRFVTHLPYVSMSSQMADALRVRWICHGDDMPICKGKRLSFVGFPEWHLDVFAQMAVACTAMPLNMAASKCSELRGQ